MKLDKNQIEIVQNMGTSGAFECLKEIIEQMISELRAARTVYSSNEETLQRLHESCGGEKYLMQLITFLYDSAKGER